MVVGNISAAVRIAIEVTGEAAALLYAWAAHLFGPLAARILVATAAIWGLFVLFPQLDILVSGLFAAPGGGFPLSANPWLQSLRTVSSVLTILVGASMLAVIGWSVLYGRAPWRMLRPCQALFVTLVYLGGPMLIVNQILKNTYGRARPREVLEFGGSAHFTPVWQVADQCVRNCSFTSGEAASAIAMLSLAFLVCRRWRPVALIAIIPMAVIFSVNRIAFGGHFLSDVLMSWMIVGFLMAALAHLMLMPGRMDAIDRALTRDGSAAWSPTQRLWVSRILTANTENTAAKT